MLLYFSTEKNSSIFQVEAEKLAVEVKLEKENCFSDYIKRNLNSLNHIEFLAIDLEYIIDDNFLKSLDTFKKLNSNISIIIVGLEKEKGDSTLAKLYNLEIYNFITSKDEVERQKEVKGCLYKLNTAENSVDYRLEEITEEKEVVEKKSKLTNLFGNLKKEKQEKHIRKTKEETNLIEEITKPIIEPIKDNVSTITKEKTEDTKDIIEDTKVVIEDEKVQLPIVQSFEEKSEESKISKEELEDKVNDLFGNTNFLSKKQKRVEKLELKFIDNTNIALFFYYGKAVGVYDKNTNNCIIDEIFEKEDIKRFFKEKDIDTLFKENTLEKIKNFK